MKSRLHIKVFGDVQGVFFRAGAVGEARRIGGITGWVQNCPGGAVEVLAEGEKESLRCLMGWCSHGPEGAVVERMEHEWLGYKGEFVGFEVKYLR